MDSELILRSLLRGLASELQQTDIFLAWKIPCTASTELAEVLRQGASNIIFLDPYLGYHFNRNIKNSPRKQSL